MRVGFVLWEAVLITIAVETTFLLSGWSILWNRQRGTSPGAPAYWGFSYGLGLVFFSNAAYTVGLGYLFENQFAGWTLALSVVAGVIISEAIISRNLAAGRPDERETESTSGQPTINRMDETDGMDEVVEPSIDQYSGIVRPDEPVKPTSGQPDEVVEAGRMDDQDEVADHEVKPDEVVEMVETIRPTSAAELDELARRRMKKERPTDHEEQSTDQKKADDGRMDETDKVDEGQADDEAVDQNENESTIDHQPEELDEKRSTKSTKRSTSTPTSKRSTKSTDQPAADEELVEVAKKYLDENGRPPSRRQLAELAGVTQYKAGKALKVIAG
ncbi:hypothetical protein [Paludifilum halophilum]|nr:hypothetical protein [Paludifilum halophilum]